LRENITSWMNENKLILNETKTKTVLFGRRFRLGKTVYNKTYKNSVYNKTLIY
jgi:hypothetical protein